MPTKRNKALRTQKLSPGERVLALATTHGILRPRDLAQHHLPREYLVRLQHTGHLERVGRGLYRPASAAITEQHTLALVSKRLPQGVICLLSALQFHGLTTQMPTEVWVALDPKVRRPQLADLPVRLVRFSGAALQQGHAAHQVEGVTVRVTTPAKTVADCFKYRHKIGLDVALEALREGWRARRFTLTELWQAARWCRVTNVIRPYLEMLT